MHWWRYLFYSPNVAITYIIRLLIQSISSPLEGGITTREDGGKPTSGNAADSVWSLLPFFIGRLHEKRSEEKIKFARKLPLWRLVVPRMGSVDRALLKSSRGQRCGSSRPFQHSSELRHEYKCYTRFTALHAFSRHISMDDEIAWGQISLRYKKRLL